MKRDIKIKYILDVLLVFLILSVSSYKLFGYGEWALGSFLLLPIVSWIIRFISALIKAIRDDV